MDAREYDIRLRELIDKLRPFLISDGGNLEFVKYEDNIVYIRLLGACKDCDMMDITLKEGIEEIIISELPEVKEVRIPVPKLEPKKPIPAKPEKKKEFVF